MGKEIERKGDPPPRFTFLATLLRFYGCSPCMWMQSVTRSEFHTVARASLSTEQLNGYDIAGRKAAGGWTYHMRK